MNKFGGIDLPSNNNVVVICDEDDRVLEDADALTTLDGRKVSLGSNEAHEIRSALRALRDSDRNTGVFDPFTFVAFCEDENIDTNYLPLLRALAGCGNGKEVGRLPLRELKCFGTEHHWCPRVTIRTGLRIRLFLHLQALMAGRIPSVVRKLAMWLRADSVTEGLPPDGAVAPGT